MKVEILNQYTQVWKVDDHTQKETRNRKTDGRKREIERIARDWEVANAGIPGTA